VKTRLKPGFYFYIDNKNIYDIVNIESYTDKRQGGDMSASSNRHGGASVLKVIIFVSIISFVGYFSGIPMVQFSLLLFGVVILANRLNTACHRCGSWRTWDYYMTRDNKEGGPGFTVRKCHNDSCGVEEEVKDK